MDIKSKLGEDGTLQFISGVLETNKPGPKKKIKFSSLQVLKEHLADDIVAKSKELAQLIDAHNNLLRAYDPATFSNTMEKFVSENKVDFDTEPAVELRFIIDKQGRPEFKKANITVPFITTLGGEEVETLDGLVKMLKGFSKETVAEKVKELFQPSVKDLLSEVFEFRSPPNYAHGDAITQDQNKMGLKDLNFRDRYEARLIPSGSTSRKQMADRPVIEYKDVKAKEKGLKRQELWAEDDSEQMNIEAHNVTSSGEVPQSNIFKSVGEKVANVAVDVAASVIAGTASGIISNGSYSVQQSLNSLKDASFKAAPELSYSTI